MAESYGEKWKSLSGVPDFGNPKANLQASTGGGLPFSPEIFQPTDQTYVSCIAGVFLTSWVTKEARIMWRLYI